MSVKTVKFHIQSGDYFGTLATILNLIVQTTKNSIENEKIFKKLVKDLTYLQKEYYILKKES